MTTSQLQLTTLDGCGLAIGSYPRFRYDASGGQSVRLEGSLNASSGAVHLHFRARFFFRVGRLYRALGLLVETELTTGGVQSRRHRVEGETLDGQGNTLLVGVAQVLPSGEGWVDRFLGLPDEALALLRWRFHNLEPTPPR